MTKIIKVPDVAQWEETDSILAKNTIGRLENEVRTAYDRGYIDCSRHDRDVLERKHQQLEHIEQVNKKLYERIDKAIEYLESYNIDFKNSKFGEAPISLRELGDLLDILKGENNENE